MGEVKPTEQIKKVSLNRPEKHININFIYHQERQGSGTRKSVYTGLTAVPFNKLSLKILMLCL